MVVELKTLKDFDYSVVSTIGCRAYKGRVEDLKDITQKVSIDELRQEAIRWIKGFQKEEVRYICGEPLYPIQDDLMTWIKHFFNITEEELN